MSSVKLTLLVEKAAAARAKRYSKRHRTSVSRLVSNMFANLPEDGKPELPPGVLQLVGVLPRNVSLDEHRRHLRDKYRL
ncbi:MAG: DUF6364 family protein [Alphaproteobacteria bacterium]|nr:DUF6364 family protein [Alphaproteobacteria bacterium]